MNESEDKPESATLPLVEETIAVDKRQVMTGKVRVRTVVSEHDELVSQLLRNEEVEIRRVKKDEPVVASPPIREEGDTIIIPVVEEVLVVEKRLVLKEEIHVTKHARLIPTEQPVTLRREDIVIERHGQKHDSNLSKE